MHFTQYAMACILALPSLTLSAPLPTIPSDASPLDGRDPKFVTNLNHFLSTSGHAPFSAPKPTGVVDAGLDIERRNPARYRIKDNAPPEVSTGLRPVIDAFTAGSPSSGVASGKGGAKGRRG
ncbi:hypothetical protein B0O99DRAFT_696300 [Bisporella sp. PMI_857]|nr:hypothetical protein B0O99DRAFT_696300 [Bisporella sp. PMI_857]